MCSSSTILRISVPFLALAEGLQVGGELVQGLVAALDGTEVLHDEVARLCCREGRLHRDAGPAAFILERDGALKRVWVGVFTGAMDVCDSLRRRYIRERHQVRVIRAVWAVHDVAPAAACTDVGLDERVREAFRPPPVNQVLGLGPDGEYQVTWGV